MRHSASLHSQDTDAPVRPSLYAVPMVDSESRSLSMSLVFEDDFDELPPELSSSWAEENSLDEALLAQGFPVAQPFGDALPDQVDESADVHEAAVVNIETARLRRFLKQMDPLRSKIIRLGWGLDGPPHSQQEIAARTGLSRAAVRRHLDEGLAELRERFGVSLTASA
jgi:DNA-directed RNA polymerase specialized sigma24 family protein